MSFQIPRIFLTSPKAGAQYDSFVLALIVALRKAGVACSCLVVGEHFEKAVIIRRLVNRYVRILSLGSNLPGRMVSELVEASSGSELLIIVGAAQDFQYDLELAKYLKCPVLAAGSYTGEDYDTSDLNILNISFDNTLSFQFNTTNQELIIIPTGFSLSKAPASFGTGVLNKLATLISPELINQVRINAKTASSVKLSAPIQPKNKYARIAVADDPCFVYGYQNNLDLLQFFGAELVSVSPLVDPDLPEKVGALYLPGAILSDYASELISNQNFISSVERFVNMGGVLYAESSSIAYLCKSFQFGNQRIFNGVGVLNAKARWQPLEKRESLQCELMEDTILGYSGERFAAYYSREWKITTSDTIMKMVRGGNSGDPLMDGYSPLPDVLCLESFVNFSSNPMLADAFVQAASVRC